MIITDVNTALKTTLDAALTGITVYDYIPNSVIVPSIVIGQPTRTEYEITFNIDCLTEIDVPLLIFVSSTNDKSGQRAMSDFLSSEGTTSIRHIIRNDYTLGGTVTGAFVTDATENTTTLELLQGIGYYSATINVNIKG